MKKWFKGKGFGFVKHDDGGDDVFVHWKQQFETEELQQGDRVSYDTEYDDRKGIYRALNCTVTFASASGTLEDGGDDVFIHCKQLVDTEELQQGKTVS